MPGALLTTEPPPLLLFWLLASDCTLIPFSSYTALVMKGWEKACSGFSRASTFHSVHFYKNERKKLTSMKSTKSVSGQFMISPKFLPPGCLSFPLELGVMIG